MNICHAVVIAAVAGLCSAMPAGAEEVGVGVGPVGVTVGSGDHDRDRDRDKTVIIKKDRDHDRDGDKTVIIEKDRNHDRRPVVIDRDSVESFSGLPSWRPLLWQSESRD